MKLGELERKLCDTNLSNPYFMFKFSIRSQITRKYYERRIKKFFDFIEFSPDLDIEERCNKFAHQASKSLNWALDRVVYFLQFEKERTQKGQITAATLRNFVKALKLFCEMADIKIPWKKIVRGLPRPRESANDRAPTIEEIQKLIEYPDRRIKPVVLLMASSGIRLGAFDFLRWKHIIPVYDENNEVIAAKIIVYAGDNDEYYSFMTQEAYKSIKNWIDFRASYGEKNLNTTRNPNYESNLNHGSKNHVKFDSQPTRRTSVSLIM
jgi:integrase